MEILRKSIPKNVRRTDFLRKRIPDSGIGFRRISMEILRKPWFWAASFENQGFRETMVFSRSSSKPWFSKDFHGNPSKIDPRSGDWFSEETCPSKMSCKGLLLDFRRISMEILRKIMLQLKLGGSWKLRLVVGFSKDFHGNPSKIMVTARWKPYENNGYGSLLDFRRIYTETLRK